MRQLEGSEKQIAWAADIRTDLLAHIAQKSGSLADQVARIEARPEDHPYAPRHPTMAAGLNQYRQLFADLNEAAGLIENEGSAKWFIDHRHGLGYAVMAVLKRDLAMTI